MSIRLMAGLLTAESILFEGRVGVGLIVWFMSGFDVEPGFEVRVGVGGSAVGEVDG